MFSLETTLFAVALVVGSALLVRWHLAAGKKGDQESLDDKYRHFLRNQCRRRVQVSGMIGLMGLLMFVGQFLADWPLLNVMVWAGVLLLACWVILLAMADWLISRTYLNRVRREQITDAVRFYAEISRRDGGNSAGESDAAS